MRNRRDRRRTLPLARPVAVSDVDLYVLAGLPKEVFNASVDFLRQKAKAGARVLGVPSASKDGRLYSEALLKQLLNLVLPFADRRIRNRPSGAPVQPKRLMLFYVPASDQEELLQAFDFFVFPVTLNGLCNFEHGRQSRHVLGSCFTEIQGALEKSRYHFERLVKPRVLSRKSAEGLLLPPRNFRLRSGQIGELFYEFTRGSRAWDDHSMEGAALRMFDHDDLPNFLRQSERQSIFQDARGLVFPCARPAELHGTPPPASGGQDLAYLQYNLRSFFRFGVPLEEGFHHDVQFEQGRPVSGVEFECSRNGCLQVSATHVNIYPNDYVRPNS
jgi:hypothetical protein